MQSYLTKTKLFFIIILAHALLFNKFFLDLKPLFVIIDFTKLLY
jgi:hypothetical protein